MRVRQRAHSVSSHGRAAAVRCATIKKYSTAIMSAVLYLLVFSL
jgi:hypothetical protein